MQWTHEGKTITINTEGFFQFEGESRQYGSLTEAKARITALNKGVRQSETKAMNLAVLNAQGMAVIIRRLHEGTGNWLTRPEEQEPPFYINNPEVAALLQEFSRLRTAAAKIMESVVKGQIRYRQVYGRQTADNVDKATKAFLEAVETAKKTWETYRTDK